MSKLLASRARRPDIRKHHFPSRDIWEDAPNSLQLETTVETPEPTVTNSEAEAKPSAVFEPPESEQLRKAEFIEPERHEAIRDPSQSMVKPKFNQTLQGEMNHSRPGLAQRFPSRDIWEDTPDSLRLETTVGNQAVNVDTKSLESTTSKPTIPARPTRSRPEIKTEAPAVSSR